MGNRRLCQDDDETTGRRHWMSSLFRNRAQSSDDLRMIGTTSATCVKTNAEEFTGIASGVVVNDVAPVSRCAGKRKITEVLGQEVTEDTRNGFGKRLRFLDTAISQRQDGCSVAVEGRTVGRHGHSFSQVYSTDNAHVHMGDRYGDGTTINHNYFGLCAAMNLRLSQDIEPTEEAAILRLAVVILVAAVANVIVQPFLLLRNALHRALPHAAQRRATPLSSLFGSRMVLFEDALGRFERIDINIVTDWTSFHYNLTRAFADHPGHRRVAVAGYRLFDQAQDTQLIDPRRPPPFASVFMRNKHVRTSIHFAWDEVSLECCPKCGLKQVCELDKETICKAKACGFSYRGHIKDSPIVELEDDDDPGTHTNVEQRVGPRKRLLKNERENPAWFSRISVSRQPEESATHKNSEVGVDTNYSDMLAHDPPTQPVDVSSRGATLIPLHESVHPSNYRDADTWPWVQRSSQPLPAASGESQKALDDDAKLRAHNSNALDNVSSNEQNTPSVSHPTAIFRQSKAKNFREKKNQDCATCGKGFVARKDLRRHEKIHSPTQNVYFCDHFGCVYAARGFARKDNLLRHQKTHHIATGDECTGDWRR